MDESLDDTVVILSQGSQPASLDRHNTENFDFLGNRRAASDVPRPLLHADATVSKEGLPGSSIRPGNSKGQ
ncbi:MAG TPA: hypothetical protein VGV92_08360 [Gammaproteobacteria bacterium]|nr:hypothetical protein [Gammaproteobacteria bacterium]